MNRSFGFASASPVLNNRTLHISPHPRSTVCPAATIVAFPRVVGRGVQEKLKWFWREKWPTSMFSSVEASSLHSIPLGCQSIWNSKLISNSVLRYIVWIYRYQLSSDISSDELAPCCSVLINKSTVVLLLFNPNAHNRVHKSSPNLSWARWIQSLPALWAPKWPLPLQIDIFMYFSWPHVFFMSHPSHPQLFNQPINRCHLKSTSLCIIPCSSSLGPDIILGTLFSNTLNLW